MIRKKVSAGQTSVELIAVLGISLLALLIFAVLSSDMVSGMSSQRKYREASDSVQKIAFAADSVYAQGDGASTIVKITLPPGTVFDTEFTFIGKPRSASSNFSSNMINMRIENTDVFAATKAPLAGSFPSSIGTYTVKVASRGSYVTVSNYLLEIDKPSVFKSMARSETRNETITLRSVSNNSVIVNITYGQSYGNLALALSQSNFVITPMNSTGVRLDFTSNAAAGGLYNWDIVVLATSAGTGERETFTLPVTADVQT